MPKPIRLPIIFRRERAKPYSVIAVFPGELANRGRVDAYVPCLDPPAEDFRCYCCAEVSLDWLYSRTRPAKDPADYEPLKRYIESRLPLWFQVPAELAIRHRITNAELLHAWAWAMPA